MLIDHINNLTSDAVEKWRFNTRGGISTAAFGVTESLRYLLPFIAEKPFLYIAKDALSAKKASEEMTCLTGREAVYLPAKDDVLLFKKFFNKDNLYERVAALYKMSVGAKYVVTTIEALMQPFPLSLPSLTVFTAREYSLDALVRKLVKMGYKRRDFADQKGEFALRGDIFEVFPTDSDRPYRVDFFGDEVERIREIDQDRKSGEEVRSFRCLPTIDFFIEEDEIEGIKAKIGSAPARHKLIGAKMKSTAMAKEILSCLENGQLTEPCLSVLTPLLKDATNDIKKVFSSMECVYIEEPKLVADGSDGVYKEHLSRFKSLFDAGEAFDFCRAAAVEPQIVYDAFTVPCHSLQNINSAVRIFTPIATIRFSSAPAPRYQRDANALPTDVRNWQKSGYKVIIACGNAQRSKNTASLLSGAGVEVLDTDNVYEDKKSYATTHYFSNGFIFHDEKTVLIGTLDLFVSGLKEKKIRKRRGENFAAPEVGDFAVHETYGIGILRGTKRITTTEGSRDYVALEYAGGDFMYVPTDQMDLLTKYLGGEKAPMLSKLGGGEFEKIKERVRQSISLMSINLKKLYKSRAASKGFRFSPDNELTEEFDAAFGFDLTEDQVQSICEIKKDMESDRIMDRLLLGDVGFGKTEVALRAAFKAVLDGKQVAIVAPTTILTEQHYQTVEERFKGFGVRCCVLNRFRSGKNVKESVRRIAEGDMDIIIGTHRIFGKDVVFHDLGLLILDEEQCFGVEHKEKLRLMKNNVDTLTLSATPIPRT
ncbi:MAG: DEAD/DEAH box helicase, partial [Clostridia bacterium]|nr:DEAD/DEAH box helicase [Clostridia bacterium]